MGNNPCDDLAIQREIKKIYTRGKILMNNFKHCCNNVKNVFFKTFCSNFFLLPSRMVWLYCSELLIAFSKVSSKILMQVCLTCLQIIDWTTSMFCAEKSIYNFLSRLKCSENNLHRSIAQPQYFRVSSFKRNYVKILHRYIYLGGGGGNTAHETACQAGTLNFFLLPLYLFIYIDQVNN